MGEDDLSTILQIPYAPSPPPDATWRLSVASGPDPSPMAELDGTSRILVGQSPACELRVQDPALSRRHAALEPVGGRLRLTDLGSTNGTYVNGVLVLAAFLQGGEELRMGGTTFLVERGAAPRNARLPERTRFGRVIGWSREMRRVYALAERLAATQVPVVIE